jgi:glycosyltransferase involved in cell wall biosynthesis
MTCRILHVVGGMQRGGIENWLIHFLRAIDHRHYHIDFLLLDNRPSAYDREILQLGSKLLYCRAARNPWKFARDFARVLKTQEPYDVVHSHVYSFTGFVLRLAARQGIPLRIAHAHDDRRAIEARRGIVRKCQRRLMKFWIDRHAVVKLAASGDAADDLFGAGWRRDPSARVLHCGVDLAPFRADLAPADVRKYFGLPVDALVIGHVGRFATQKNHKFVVEVAAEAIKLDQRVRLLLVGDGPLRPEIERQVDALGIVGSVVFAGERDDVPAIMRSAMDVIVFPSLHEGLGLVLIEAQAAGRPCLIADRVPREADVVPGLISRRSIDEVPALWAERLLEIAAAPRIGRAKALAAVERSPFNIMLSVQQLARIYDGEFSQPDSVLNS